METHEIEVGTMTPEELDKAVERYRGFRIGKMNWKRFKVDSNYWLRVTALLLWAGVLLLFLSSCVTGPVQKGPVKTRDVQAMGEDEGRKLAEIATRNTGERYDGLTAQVWRTWKRGEAKLQNKKPSAQLTPDQVQLWANTIATQLIKAAQARDDKLQTLNRKRTTELEHIIKLQNNQIAILAGQAAKALVIAQQGNPETTEAHFQPEAD
ncbi:hypothetical protein LCGC14_2621970 [marine sediment metagenome]|uniref:Uncharacterized protein n=1 Tax=marine sediment metagenome TaxID=412755 RepID=A0A0F9A2R2_9ZZZZ